MSSYHSMNADLDLDPDPEYGSIFPKLRAPPTNTRTRSQTRSRYGKHTSMPISPTWVVPLLTVVTLVIMALSAYTRTPTSASSTTSMPHPDIITYNGKQYILISSVIQHQGQMYSAATATHNEYHVMNLAEKDDKDKEKDKNKGPTNAIFNGDTFAQENELLPVWSTEWYICVGLSIGCVILAGLGSGLAMGLLSIDPFQLAVVLETDPADFENDAEREQLVIEKTRAAKVMPLVNRHHLILVTLLIVSSTANEALPLFLDHIVPTYVAVILSVTLVLVFTEIVPSAIFTGPNQLRIASFLTPVVWLFVATFYMISKPLAWILDRIIEEDQTRYRRGELKAIVKLHAQQSEDHEHLISPPSLHSHSHSHLHHDHDHNNNNNGEHDDDDGLTIDEITIIHGALELKRHDVGDCMVPWEKVFRLPSDAHLDTDRMAQIVGTGHSRIPIVDRHDMDVRGVLIVKRLIVLNPLDERSIRSLGLRRPLVVLPTMPLLEILNEFQTGKSHMAIVCTDPDAIQLAWKTNKMVPSDAHVLGIITLEDVLERLLKEDICDETDITQGVRHDMKQTSLHHSRIQKFKALAACMKQQAILRRSTSIHALSPGILPPPSTLRQQNSKTDLTNNSPKSTTTTPTTATTPTSSSSTSASTTLISPTHMSHSASAQVLSSRGPGPSPSTSRGYIQSMPRSFASRYGVHDKSQKICPANSHHPTPSTITTPITSRTPLLHESKKQPSYHAHELLQQVQYDKEHVMVKRYGHIPQPPQPQHSHIKHTPISQQSPQLQIQQTPPLHPHPPQHSVKQPPKQQPQQQQQQQQQQQSYLPPPKRPSPPHLSPHVSTSHDHVSVTPTSMYVSPSEAILSHHVGIPSPYTPQLNIAHDHDTLLTYDAPDHMHPGHLVISAVDHSQSYMSGTTTIPPYHTLQEEPEHDEPHYTITTTSVEPSQSRNSSRQHSRKGSDGNISTGPSERSSQRSAARPIQDISVNAASGTNWLSALEAMENQPSPSSGYSDLSVTPEKERLADADSVLEEQQRQQQQQQQQQQQHQQHQQLSRQQQGRRFEYP